MLAVACYLNKKINIMTTLNSLLKYSAYKSTQFSLAQIEALENCIFEK